MLSPHWLVFAFIRLSQSLARLSVALLCVFLQLPIKFGIQCPVDPSQPEFNLVGQIVPVELPITAQVSSIKDALQTALNGIPQNKLQFKHWSGFLKDTNTLAFYNVNPGEVLELSLRTRGGRR